MQKELKRSVRSFFYGIKTKKNAKTCSKGDSHGYEIAPGRKCGFWVGGGFDPAIVPGVVGGSSGRQQQIRTATAFRSPSLTRFSTQSRPLRERIVYQAIKKRRIRSGPGYPSPPTHRRKSLRRTGLAETPPLIATTASIKRRRGGRTRREEEKARSQSPRRGKRGVIYYSTNDCVTN